MPLSSLLPSNRRPQLRLWFPRPLRTLLQLCQPSRRWLLFRLPRPPKLPRPPSLLPLPQPRLPKQPSSLPRRRLRLPRHRPSLPPSPRRPRISLLVARDRHMPPRHLPRQCPPGVWSCRRRVPVRFTRRPLLPHRLLLEPLLASFPAEGPFSTAEPANQAPLLHAPPEARPASLLAVHAPSIPRALPAVMPALARLALVPACVPALALVPALPVLAEHRQPAKRPVQHALLPEAAADARSIPRPRKAR